MPLEFQNNCQKPSLRILRRVSKYLIQHLIEVMTFICFEIEDEVRLISTTSKLKQRPSLFRTLEMRFD